MNKEQISYLVQTGSESFLGKGYYQNGVCVFKDKKDVLDGASLYAHSKVSLDDPALQRQLELAMNDVLDNLTRSKQILVCQQTGDLSEKQSRAVLSAQEIAQREKDVVLQGILSELGLDSLQYLDKDTLNIFDSETKGLVKKMAREAQDKMLFKVADEIAKKGVSWQTNFEVFSDIVSIYLVISELLDMSFGGFFPIESAPKVARYLWDCKKQKCPVVFQYIFSPNYDPESSFALNSCISKFRLQRLETFARLDIVLTKLGFQTEFHFYYDDVPDHLEYKVREHYNNGNNGQLECLINASFTELNLACVASMGRKVSLQRITQTSGFESYYQDVESQKRFLANGSGLEEMVDQITDEDMQSVSRHRFGLSYDITEQEVIKRLAQGRAGLEFCKSQNGKSIIITMETNRKELGAFLNGGDNIVLNLQKTVEH